MAFTMANLTFLASVIIFTFGLYLFISGFLLTRQSLDRTSSCDDLFNLDMLSTDEFQSPERNFKMFDCLPASFDESSRAKPANLGASIAMDGSIDISTSALGGASAQARPARVFLFIVDALRSDMFLNRSNFPRLHAYRDAHADTVTLVRQIADPPTTTSQRVRLHTPPCPRKWASRAFFLSV